MAKKCPNCNSCLRPTTHNGSRFLLCTLCLKVYRAIYPNKLELVLDKFVKDAIINKVGKTIL